MPVYWPRMSALHRQHRRDVKRPIAPQPVGYGLVLLRPLRFLDSRIEYGMGHAWRVIKVGPVKFWMRVEVGK